MNTRLGCFSGTGLLVTLLAVLLIGGVSVARGGILFNPGPLNAQSNNQPATQIRSHADIQRCSTCHPAFWEKDRLSDRCLDCHNEVVAQIQDASGLHGFLSNLKEQNCRRCHTEHHGAQAALTRQGALNNYPHEEYGYSLTAHAQTAEGRPFACADCHTTHLSQFDPGVCTACHRDLDPGYVQAHIAAFGEACLDCHNGLDTYGRRFDHQALSFPLQGRHAQVDCAACHIGARSKGDLRATQNECFDCHVKDDAHGGEFGRNCATCHTPQGWEGATFDHSLSAFPLTGAHQTIECSQCHIEGASGRVYQGTPTDCFACHAADDAHAGEFGQDCAGCHTPQDWEEADFDHSLSAFPLTGAHQNLACSQCHQEGPTGTVFKATNSACAACHTEPTFHAGLFDPGCEVCHSTSAWSPANYDRAHTFPLNHGREAASTCRTCHSETLQVYTCYGCHDHNPSQIESKHREEGIRNFQDCARCHPTGQEEEGEGGEND